MRAHFDPEFSFQSSRNLVPAFSEHINQWCNAFSSGNTSQEHLEAEYKISIIKECKLLAFRLIALSLYGDLFNETVRLPVLRLIKNQ